jgi:hypothetical protein
MKASTVSVLAGTQAPAREPRLDVRSTAGDLVGRVSPAKANELIVAGLVSPIGRKAIKYLVLTCDEPILERPWRGGSHTTRTVRADQTCLRYADGQLMGTSREHKTR